MCVTFWPSCSWGWGLGIPSRRIPLSQTSLHGEICIDPGLCSPRVVFSRPCQLWGGVLWLWRAGPQLARAAGERTFAASWLRVPLAGCSLEATLPPTPHSNKSSLIYPCGADGSLTSWNGRGSERKAHPGNRGAAGSGPGVEASRGDVTTSVSLTLPPGMGLDSCALLLWSEGGQRIRAPGYQGGPVAVIGAVHLGELGCALMLLVCGSVSLAGDPQFTLHSGREVVRFRL